jgi:GxxExxY protein
MAGGMPIEGLELPRLGREEMRETDYEVMKHAFAAHSELGRMCDEGVYQADLTARLEAAGIAVQREAGLLVRHGGFVKRYELDLVVAGRFVYELKVVSLLTGKHEAQLLNYLLLTNTAHGKLINFRPGQMEARFVNAPVDERARHRFRLVRDDFRDAPGVLRDTMLSLAEDWGLFLDLALYTDALTYFLGGEDEVVHSVPVERNGTALGCQRVRLCSPNAAFRVTAFKENLPAQEAHFRRMLKLTSLKAIHWINLCRNEMSLLTIS